MLNETGVILSDLYKVFNSALPSWMQSFAGVFFLSLLIVIYAVFVWKFYRYVARKNILELNLKKYNTSEHPIFSKASGIFFYLVEYIFILPFLIFFWFGIFTVFLVFLNESLSTSAVLVVAAAIIGAVRMTAYYNEEAAKEIAKFLPLMLLAISILNPSFFNIERIFSTLAEIPTLIGSASIYLIFIIVLEVILRTFDFLFSLMGINSEKEKEE